MTDNEIMVELFNLMLEHNSHYQCFCDGCFSDTAEEHHTRIAHLADHLLANSVRIPVFCKNCESADPTDDKGGLVCTIWGAPTEPNRYCSEGERRNSE